MSVHHSFRKRKKQASLAPGTLLPVKKSPPVRPPRVASWARAFTYTYAYAYIGCRSALAPDVMGRSTASVEPAPGDGAPERPNDVGANDNKAATPGKASAQGSVSGYDAPTPGSTEQISSAASAAENPRGSGRSSGSSVGPPFPKGSRREQLRRSATMHYDPDDELTCMQRMWMLLDDPSFSRGTPRLSLVAR